MATKTRTLRIDDIRGGINEHDPFGKIPDNQVLEATNIDFSSGALGRKRNGTVKSIYQWSHYPTYTDFITSLVRHTPTADEKNTELWCFDKTGRNMRCQNNGYSGGYTYQDAFATDAGYNVVGASLGGRLFLAYDSAVDRLHVYDSRVAVSFRRVGFAVPGDQLSVANQGSGTYAATLRYYKVCFTQKDGSNIVRRSEPSTAEAFTPSGSGSAARVTVTLLGEYETHWELYGSADAVNYYRIAEVAVATTYVDDNLPPSSYASTGGRVLDVAGTNLPPPSAKYVICDENRLILAHGYENSAWSSRVWWTPVIGSSECDDERVPNTTTLKSYLDLDVQDGGGITGIASLNGVIYVFKLNQTYKLVRTGQVDAPYLPVTISKTVGCVRHQTIVQAEDETGAPCLYFLSRRGPYRIGQRGMEFIGTDIERTWKNVSTDTSYQAGHGVYHAEKHQVWWWVAASTEGDIRLRYSIRDAKPGIGGMRGGWAKDSYNILVHMRRGIQSYCSAMYTKTPGSNDVSRSMVPYCGAMYINSADSFLLKCDEDGVYTDVGDSYTSSFLTQVFMPDMGKAFGVTEAHLLAKTISGETPTVQVSVIRDFGKETVSKSVTLSGTSPPTSQIAPLDSLSMSAVRAIQIKVEDTSAAEGMELDAVSFRLRSEEEV